MRQKESKRKDQNTIGDIIPDPDGNDNILIKRSAYAEENEREILYESMVYLKNKLINLVSLMSAEVKALDQKADSSAEFVEEYMYREKIPSVLTAIEKDIEYLKERRRSNDKR